MHARDISFGFDAFSFDDQETEVAPDDVVSVEMVLSLYEYVNFAASLLVLAVPKKLGDIKGSSRDFIL